MPEGPSIVILKEAVQSFEGKTVRAVSGNSKKIDFIRMEGKRITEFKSWGKHFLICFDDFTVRIHFLLFGSYRINERKETTPRLSLVFDDGEINFYACSVLPVEGDINLIYDWSADVMNDGWDDKKAMKKLKEKADTLVCDILLDQDVFAGVGNIIKNEVLYRIRVHPESKTGNLPLAKKRELIKEAVNYSFDFMRWKKEYKLKANWLAHTKKICSRDQLPILKSYPGKTKRRAFYCMECQVLY